MKKIAVNFGIFLFLVTGCATTVEKTGKYSEVEPAKVIKTGVTTKEEIIKALGEPSSSSMKDGAEELVYEGKKVETRTYLGGVLVDDARKESTTKRLQVIIRDGIVQSYKYEMKEE